MIVTNWFFSAERGGQSDSAELHNRDPIIPKMGVITEEPPYHVKYGSSHPGLIMYLHSAHLVKIHTQSKGLIIFIPVEEWLDL